MYECQRQAITEQSTVRQIESAIAYITKCRSNGT